MKVLADSAHPAPTMQGLDLIWFRPRAGRSPWRAFYRRVADTLVIGAIGPEAHVDPRGFGRAIRAAEARLARIE